MGIGRTNAAGKAAPNFDVKRYSTEAELLAATPKENTIGIISEHEMTGWIIDANQPENMTEGMVWISVGTESVVEFNALRKNGIQVYPLRAKQMVDGALVDVTAMSYQRGEWLDWFLYLYEEGDQCENVTGGWERKAYGGITAGSVSLEQNSLKIVSGIEATVCCGLKDFDPNSLKTKSKISCIVDCSVGSGTTTVKVGVVPDYNLGTSSIDSKWICSATVTITGTHEISAEFPLGTIGYPMVSAYNATADYSKIWIE